MIWKYRAVNNPIAKRKWLSFCLILLAVGVCYAVYKYSVTGNLRFTLLSLSFFSLMIFLYTIITLGKVRYYYINDEIVYKPFKTPLSNIEDLEVDYENKVIRLKLGKPSLFAVKTLYFENDEDLEEAARFLKRKLGKI